MDLYKEYMKNNLDLSALGLMKRDGDGYFCTPKNAQIIGWTGVDGIHYCKIKKFGETVFCVDPMGDTGRCVFPVAEDFEMFLRLLLACKDEAYIEQAHVWTREKFEEYVSEYTPDAKAENTLAILKDEYGLLPMKEPHPYLKALYDGFDYGKIPYTDEYYEYVPREEPPKETEWKVYFSMDDHKGERAGEPMVLDAHFSWGENDFYVPCAYICGKGLVLDIFFEADTEKTQAFLFRYLNAASEEEHDRMRDENPLVLNYRATLTVNGDCMKEKRAEYRLWAEGFESYESAEMREILEHYGMDTEKCWGFQRISFPWATKSKPKIRSLSLSLAERPKSVRGDRFRVSGAGNTVSFVHPITRVSHTMTVQAYEQTVLETLFSDGYEHPTHFTQLSYTVEPPLSPSQFHISDTRRSDLPRKINNAEIPRSDFASALAIIGGADGPTAVFSVRKQDTDGQRTASSSLSFAPRTDVEWQMIFRERSREDTEIVLFLK